MRFLQLISTTAAVLGLASAAPAQTRAFSAPTNDGYPNPNPSQLAVIDAIADGQISNAPPPPKLAASSLTAFQLIAFNEEFEVAFFSSLIDNITAGTPGFAVDDVEKDELLTVLKTVKAQEELHAISALQVLEHFNVFAPPPCTYLFGTVDVQSALAVAATFTSVVLGTLQDASQLLATNGDAAPVRTISSIVGQEGEQDGFYRSLLGRKPSEKPFLTTNAAPFLLSELLQDFVVACPFNVTEELSGIPVFPALRVLGGSGSGSGSGAAGATRGDIAADVAPEDQLLAFAADLTLAPAGWESYRGGDGSGLFVTYFTGQNLPVSEPVTAVHWSGNVVTFEAEFPFSENVMEGLSIAALTTSANFTSFDDVPNATLAAPGLIQVNDLL